jgi:hypothetical protein
LLRGDNKVELNRTVKIDPVISKKVSQCQILNAAECGWWKGEVAVEEVIVEAIIEALNIFLQKQ